MGGGRGEGLPQRRTHAHTQSHTSYGVGTHNAPVGVYRRQPVTHVRVCGSHRRCSRATAVLGEGVTHTREGPQNHPPHAPVIIVGHDVQLVVGPKRRGGGQELVPSSVPGMWHHAPRLVLERKGAHVLDLELCPAHRRCTGTTRTQPRASEPPTHRNTHNHTSSATHHVGCTHASTD